MSTRCYPIFVKGNPQLRVFLSNFWMKLVKETKYDLPNNHVKFICSIEMTKHDIKNYLEKIYKVPVVQVRTEIAEGEISKQNSKGYIVKEDDYRVAYVTLPKDYNFTFPTIIPEEQVKENKEEMKQFELLKSDYQKVEYKNKERPFVPSWFGL